MKVGFTGTQEGMTANQKLALRLALSRFGATEFHHGDCIGADEDAYAIAKEMGLRIVCHPPDNPSKRAFTDNDERREEKPYLVRNRDIVDETKVLIAAPRMKQEELRSGTWSTVRYARDKVGRPVVILEP